MNLIYVYAAQDESVANELAVYLRILSQDEVLSRLQGRIIDAEGRWRESDDAALAEVDVVLVLASPDLLASGYLQEAEFTALVGRRQRGEVRLIPLLIEPVDLRSSKVLGELRALPRNERPVSSWPNRREAYAATACPSSSREAARIASLVPKPFSRLDSSSGVIAGTCARRRRSVSRSESGASEIVSSPSTCPRPPPPAARQSPGSARGAIQSIDDLLGRVRQARRLGEGPLVAALGDALAREQRHAGRDAVLDLQRGAGLARDQEVHPAVDPARAEPQLGQAPADEQPAGFGGDLVRQVDAVAPVLHQTIAHRVAQAPVALEADGHRRRGRISRRGLYASLGRVRVARRHLGAGAGRRDQREEPEQSKGHNVAAHDETLLSIHLRTR